MIEQDGVADNEREEMEIISHQHHLIIFCGFVIHPSLNPCFFPVREEYIEELPDVRLVCWAHKFIQRRSSGFFVPVIPSFLDEVVRVGFLRAVEVAGHARGAGTQGIFRYLAVYQSPDLMFCLFNGQRHYRAPVKTFPA